MSVLAAEAQVPCATRAVSLGRVSRPDYGVQYTSTKVLDYNQHGWGHLNYPAEQSCPMHSPKANRHFLLFYQTPRLTSSSLSPSSFSLPEDSDAAALGGEQACL